MTAYMCMKSSGTFRQGRIYTFDKLTAVAGSAIRAGVLKVLPIGTPVPKAPVKLAEVKEPKKRGRPRKTSISGMADDVIDVISDLVI